MMTDGEDEYDVVLREKAILRDVAVPPSKQDQFASAVLRFTPQQGVFGKQFKCAPDTEQPPPCPDGV